MAVLVVLAEVKRAALAARLVGIVLLVLMLLRAEAGEVAVDLPELAVGEAVADPLVLAVMDLLRLVEAVDLPDQLTHQESAVMEL